MILAWASPFNVGDKLRKFCQILQKKVSCIFLFGMQKASWGTEQIIISAKKWYKFIFSGFRLLFMAQQRGRVVVCAGAVPRPERDGWWHRADVHDDPGQ